MGWSWRSARRVFFVWPMAVSDSKLRCALRCAGSQIQALVSDCKQNSSQKATHPILTLSILTLSGQSQFPRIDSNSIIRFHTWFQQRSYPWILSWQCSHPWSPPMVATIHRWIHSGRNHDDATSSINSQIRTWLVDLVSSDSDCRFWFNIRPLHDAFKH